MPEHVAKGPGDEIEDLPEVAFTEDKSQITVGGVVRDIPHGALEDYLRMAEKTTDDTRRRYFLALAKWVADQEAEYSLRVHAQRKYEHELPDKVRKLEAEVENLQKQFDELAATVQKMNTQIVRR